MRLDLHTHYDHTRSFEEHIKFISALPLDGIGICSFGDIGYVKDIRERIENKLIIVGQEILCRPFHVIGLGLEETVASGLSVEESISNIRSQGGLAVIVHPLMGGNIYGRLKQLFRYDFDALEGYSSILAPLVLPNPLARMVARIKKVPAIAASDAHKLRYMGSSYIEVPDGDRDLSRIFDHVKKGEFTCTRRGYYDFEHYWTVICGIRCHHCNEKVAFHDESAERVCQICNSVEKNVLSCTNGHYICERCFFGIG